MDLKHDVVTVLDCVLSILITRVNGYRMEKLLQLRVLCFLVWSKELSYLEAEL